jgi:hypothetical protein
MVFVLVPLLITKEGERALGLRPIGQSLSKRGSPLVENTYRAYAERLRGRENNYLAFLSF